MLGSKIRGSLGILSIAVAMTAANCALAAQPAASKSDPVPAVQNCGIITISTPNKYVCNGKIYTAYQLQQLREKAAAEAAANQARYSRPN